MFGKPEVSFGRIDVANKSFYKNVHRAYWLNRFLTRNRREIKCWACFSLLLTLIYLFLSDGSFSAVLTLSSLFQSFGFTILLGKVLFQQSSVGISNRSLHLFAVALTGRLLCNSFHHAYLPVDRTGDWVYQVSDAFTLCLLTSLLYLTYRYHDYHDSQTTDAILPTRPFISTGTPILAAAALSFLIHPSLARSRWADHAWTFGLYTETFAMLPQLFLMARSSGEVEALTSHYVASIGVSKVFAFVFWLFSYKELGTRTAFNIAGWAVLGSYGLQLLLLADFIYNYIKAVRQGKKMVLSM